MTKAILVYQPGAADAMKWEDIDVGEPGEGEIRIKHNAVGLNYIDVYFRSGEYPAPTSPFTPGLEAAGTVEAVGTGVEGLVIGDRVAYADLPMGAYAEARLFPASSVVKLPNGIDDETAAAMMLKGMTAEYLLRRTYPVQAGDTVLIHAAAGGVGLIACQWASHLGAKVIGTVGNDEKAELVKANGCHHPIVYTRENVVERVKELTDGVGVTVVYDAVGKDTFVKSLDCLKPRGMMVSYGQSSGPIDSITLDDLKSRGCIYLTRPSIMLYNSTPEEIRDSASALFDVVSAGYVKIAINQRFALADAASAHRALENRQTSGSTVLFID
jgi:NADPH2:quinone reductase